MQVWSQSSLISAITKGYIAATRGIRISNPVRDGPLPHEPPRCQAVWSPRFLKLK